MCIIIIIIYTYIYIYSIHVLLYHNPLESIVKKYFPLLWNHCFSTSLRCWLPQLEDHHPSWSYETSPMGHHGIGRRVFKPHFLGNESYHLTQIIDHGWKPWTKSRIFRAIEPSLRSGSFHCQPCGWWHRVDHLESPFNHHFLIFFLWFSSLPSLMKPKDISHNPLNH